MPKSSAISLAVDPIRNAVEIEVDFDRGLQRRMDARHGAGTVIVTPGCGPLPDATLRG